MKPTPTEIDFLLKLWPIFVGVILLVAWFIRLEAKQLHQGEKINDQNKAIDDLEKNYKSEVEALRKTVKDNNEKMWDKIDTVREQNVEILKTLSRLEGQLSKGVTA